MAWMSMNHTIPSWSDRIGHALHQTAARLSGPGGYYNIGNAFGLGMGIVLQMESIPAGPSGLEAAANAATFYLVGNPQPRRSPSAPPSSSGVARCTTAPGLTAPRRTRF